MKQQLKISEKCRRSLGAKIKQYIDEQRLYKDKHYNQTSFAKEIDKQFNLEGWEDTNPKKVSRWINGTVFPDIQSLIAISKVMNTTIDELLSENIQEKSKTIILNQEECEVLKLLIEEKRNSDDNFGVSLYLPYSFNGELLNIEQRLYSRAEALELFKQYTEQAFRNNRLQDYIEFIAKNNFSIETVKKMKKHFPRFCSIKVSENDNSVEDGLPIIYDNSDDCYIQLTKLWEKAENKYFYNFLYFDEGMVTMDDTQRFESVYRADADKDAFYKSKAVQQKIYSDKFQSLIDKKIIRPQELTKIYCEEDIEKSGEYLTLGGAKDFAYFLSIDGKDYKGKYEMELYKFNFEICLTETEIKTFLREEIDKV